MNMLIIKIEKPDKMISVPVSHMNCCSPHLDFGCVLFVLKVFDHVREPNRQTVVTVTKYRSTEDKINTYNKLNVIATQTQRLQQLDQTDD